MSIEADPDVDQIAEAYALDRVDFVRGKFAAELDGSDESVEIVEEVAALAHRMRSEKQLDPGTPRRERGRHAMTRAVS